MGTPCFMAPEVMEQEGSACLSSAFCPFLLLPFPPSLPVVHISFALPSVNFSLPFTPHLSSLVSPVVLPHCMSCCQVAVALSFHGVAWKLALHFVGLSAGLTFSFVLWLLPGCPLLSASYFLQSVIVPTFSTHTLFTSAPEPLQFLSPLPPFNVPPLHHPPPY